eukprot:2813457-Rhodomonas_salina.1
MCIRDRRESTRAGWPPRGTDSNMLRLGPAQREAGRGHHAPTCPRSTHAAPSRTMSPSPGRAGARAPRRPFLRCARASLSSHHLSTPTTNHSPAPATSLSPAPAAHPRAATMEIRGGKDGARRPGRRTWRGQCGREVAGVLDHDGARRRNAVADSAGDAGAWSSDVEGGGDGDAARRLVHAHRRAADLEAVEAHILPLFGVRDIAPEETPPQQSDEARVRPRRSASLCRIHLPASRPMSNTAALSRFPSRRLRRLVRVEARERRRRQRKGDADRALNLVDKASPQEAIPSSVVVV